jgi:hypothetical protein
MRERAYRLRRTDAFEGFAHWIRHTCS